VGVENVGQSDFFGSVAIKVNALGQWPSETRANGRTVSALFVFFFFFEGVKL